MNTAILSVVCFILAIGNVKTVTINRKHDFHSRYLDDDHFWFGTQYASYCPSGLICINIRPNFKSVMARLLETDNRTVLEEAVANMDALNVVYEHPAREYWACNHKFKIDAKPPVTVDPFRPTFVSQIILQSPPDITWTPKTPQTLYTVLMVDTSFLFFHSLWYNCPDGSYKNGEVFRDYMGPSTGFMINSPYVFLAYEQTRIISVENITKAKLEADLTDASFPGLPFFSVAAFVDTLLGLLEPDIKFSVIMELYPDPYGSYYLTNYYNFIDLCPLFYTQMPEFHAVANRTGIQLQWSPKAYSFSQVATSSWLTTLQVDVQVTFLTSGYSDSVCCTKFKLDGGEYRVSGFQTEPWRASVARDAPLVFLNPIRLLDGRVERFKIMAFTYTLVMVQSDPDSTDSQVDVHWLVANIRSTNMDTGDVVVPYRGPSHISASNGDNQTYMFLLFKQSKTVDVATFDSPCSPQSCKLSMKDLVQKWLLHEVVGINWFKSKKDEWSLKHQIMVYGQPEEKVCKGRKGYSVPCTTTHIICNSICTTVKDDKDYICNKTGNTAMLQVKSCSSLNWLLTCLHLVLLYFL